MIYPADRLYICQCRGASIHHDTDRCLRTGSSLNREFEEKAKKGEPVTLWRLASPEDYVPVDERERGVSWMLLEIVASANTEHNTLPCGCNVAIFKPVKLSVEGAEELSACFEP